MKHLIFNIGNTREDYCISVALPHVCLTSQVFFGRSNAWGTVARFNLQRQPAIQMVSIKHTRPLLLSDQLTTVQTEIHHTLLTVNYCSLITELISQKMMQKV